MIGQFLARRAAGILLGDIAAQTARIGHSRLAYRHAIMRAAERGDLDAVYDAYIAPAQKRLERYIERGTTESGKLG